MLYQHGTLGALVPGLLNGTQPLSELLTHGDFGIGTLTGLNGELIILGGKVYQVQASGKVAEISSGSVPFANVHFPDFGAPQRLRPEPRRWFRLKCWLKSARGISSPQSRCMGVSLRSGRVR
ncbi:acetolactate decarboxylase [Lacticaseibacillus camelliae]|uniref:acetolactate decarboxylase n=1 Tax=Lacticaseibacillus camelliae TaxID=381742 RepID=UPI000AC64100|nr:acetolactate decarboxylase [Lacticaseibacillus camelliae]